jgi:hypothetical protein
MHTFTLQLIFNLLYNNKATSRLQIIHLYLVWKLYLQVGASKQELN